MEDPRVVALEKKNEKRSALITSGIVVVLALISLLWTGFRISMLPPGEEGYDMVGAIDFGDNRMGSMNVNNAAPAVPNPSPTPPPQQTPAPQQAQQSKTKPQEQVITQPTPSPVSVPDKPSTKPTPQQTQTSPQNNTGSSQQQTPPSPTPSTSTSPAGSNQGNQPGSVGNSGTPTEQKFDNRYSFQWGDGGDGGGKRGAIKVVNPEYNVQEEGELTFEFTIRPDGTVANARALPTNKSALRQAGLNAIRQWRFKPLPPGTAQQDQIVRVTIVFKLKG